MALMKKEGIFAPYVPPSSQNFPDQFKEKDTLITPWRILPISILYNTELVKPGEAPKNLEDLRVPNGRARSAFLIPRDTRRRQSFFGISKN